MRKPIMVVVALLVGSAVYGADDWQTWNDYGFKIPVYKDKVKMTSKFQTRFQDDMNEFYRYQFYMGPEWKASKHLTLSAKYGNIREKSGSDWHTEHRTMFSATPGCRLSDFGVKEWGLGDLKLQVENRLEWRCREYKDHKNSWRWRVYPKVSYPLFKMEHLTISPYAADAFYFDFTRNVDFNQNRLYGGLAFKFYKKFTLSCYYMRLSKRSGKEWEGIHVLGTGVSYDF